jgi:broad specificity phosphatase PhoE
MRVILVRHAEPFVEAGKPPATWPLSPAGWDAARRLGADPVWDGVRILYHSPELKACQTAEAIADFIGAERETWDELAEAAYDGPFLVPEAFGTRVSAYLDGAPDADFEPRDRVYRRIDDVRRRLLARAEPAAGVVTHGRLMSLWWARDRGNVAPSAVWRTLGLPDYRVLTG